MEFNFSFKREIKRQFKSVFSLETRPFIDFLKMTQKKNLIGVEIGVEYGYHALQMLQTLDIKKLYLIDPYQRRHVIGKIIENDGDLIYEKAKSKMKDYKEKSIFLRKTSEEAVDDIPNNIDFVYIDGNHNYEFVKKDIELYYPKVKKGGVIAGHDFSASFFGVCRAVFEFLDKKGYDITDLQGKRKDWWFIKKWM